MGEVRPAVTRAPLLAGMPMKIGVMGSATGELAAAQLATARELGRAIASRGCLLITGGCPGLPLEAARGAKAAGGFVLGISPGLSLDEHVGKYDSPTEAHDVLIYTGSGLMGREVVNIRSSDIVVLIGGRSGTLGELAIAYDEGKLIGVVTGTGGVSDMAREILSTCKKDTGARVVYNADPQALLEQLMEVYTAEHFRRPSCFCTGRGPGVSQASQPGWLQDPVCGMWIDPVAAPAWRDVRGWHHLFCSTNCADRFGRDPGKFGRT